MDKKRNVSSASVAFETFEAKQKSNVAISGVCEDQIVCLLILADYLLPAGFMEVASPRAEHLNQI